LCHASAVLMALGVANHGRFASGTTAEDAAPPQAVAAAAGINKGGEARQELAANSSAATLAGAVDGSSGSSTGLPCGQVISCPG